LAVLSVKLLAGNTVSEMTYTVLVAALNFTQSQVAFFRIYLYGVLFLLCYVSFLSVIMRVNCT